MANKVLVVDDEKLIVKGLKFSLEQDGMPQAAGGIPFNACEFQSKGDAITDLVEDLAADGTTA